MSEVVNGVFDCESAGYMKWTCFGILCEPVATFQLAKKLKIMGPWVYMLIGFIIWAGWLMIVIADRLY